MKKGVFVVFIIAMMAASCGGRRMSADELQHKLDSVKALENKERLKAQGIDLDEETNPLKLFFDSLGVQPLPVSYSEDYVKYLPGFRPVPKDIAAHLSLEGGVQPKAVSLPETLGARLMLLAADEGDHLYSLWLYSLDNDYFPVDKLCLYAPESADDRKKRRLSQDEFVQFFSITSDYEIHLMDYSNSVADTESEEVYHVDAARKIVLQEEAE